MRSGALGITDIHDVPSPLVCSSNRDSSRGVAQSNRRSITAFQMASVQCFWNVLEASDVASGSYIPCHCCKDSNGGPRRSIGCARMGATDAELEVRAYAGTITFAQLSPRKDKTSPIRTAGWTRRGLFSPHPTVVRGKETSSRCCSDNAHPTRSSKCDKTMSIARAVSAGTQ